MLKSRFAPFIIERKNSTSLNVLRSVISGNLKERVLQIQEEKDKLEGTKESLIKLFENRVSWCMSNNEDPSKLIGIKRRIFNDKQLREKEFKYLEEMQDDLLDKTNNYYSNVISVKELEEKYSCEFDNALGTARGSMIKSFENDYLYNTLKFINISITKLLDKLKNENMYSVKSKFKRNELSFLKILLRGSTKTSPFSTFTENRFLNIEGKNTLKKGGKVYAALNVTHVLKIFNAIISDNEVRKKIPYTLNLSLDKVDDYYAYARHEVGDSEIVFETEGQLCQIRSNPLLDFLYNNFKDKTFFYNDIKKVIPKITINIFSKLLDIKFITKKLEIPMSKEKIMIDLINILKKYNLENIEIVKSIYTDLVNIQNLLENYNNLELIEQEKRYEIYCKIAALFRNIYNKLGIDGFDEHDIIYEDYFNSIESEEVKLEHEIDIDLITKLSILFDENTRAQNYIGEKFYEKYGRNEVNTDEKDMIALITKYNTKYNYLWENEWSIEESEDEVSLNKELDALKKEFTDLVLSKLDSGIIPREDVEKIVDKIPKAVLNRANSYDIYFQKTKDGYYVINDVYKGFLSYFSRFIDYCIDRNLPDVIDYKNFIFNDENRKVAEI